jgi:hypothetical protein
LKKVLTEGLSFHVIGLGGTLAIQRPFFFPPEVRFQPLEVGCILWTLSQGFFVKYVRLLLQVKGDQVILSISAFCCRLFGEDLRPSRAPSKAKSGCLGAMLTSFL